MNLRRAVRLLRTDGHGMFRAAMMTMAVRTALWSAPFPTVYAYLQRRKRLRSQTTDRNRVTSQRDIIRRVRMVSRVVPGATCLVQGLTAEQLLAEAGYLPRLHFGVNRPKGKRLTTHAWLECDGAIVLGGGLPNFTPLPMTD